MQIACPECSAKLTLSQPKPGKYRPKCKKCGKPFILQVKDGDPPKVGVGRIKSTEAPHTPTSSKPAKPETPQPKSKPKPKREAPKPASAASKPEPVKPMQPSADKPKSPVNATSQVDATMDSAEATAHSADVDATMEGSSQTGASASVSAGAGSKPPIDTHADKGAGETIDGTMDSSTNSDISVAPKPTVRSGSASRPSASASNGETEGETGITAIPERLGGYRILRMLGRGAMGAVYEAKQVSLDRNVALKTIRGRMANNPASLARFTREAYAAAQLTHHNVVQIYDFGEDDGKHFFSMEWVRGGPISDLVRDKGELDPKLAAGYALQAARGLQFAHQNGMVHRDVKPANLLLSTDGVVKVADLGLVKIPDQMDPESDVGMSSMSGMQSGSQVTMMGTAVGTPAYMAPEQGIDATTVDHRADIYSLACSLFFMLTGTPPFKGSVVSEVLKQHAEDPVPDLVDVNSRIPPQLNSIVQRGMAKRPGERYESLANMIDDLEHYLGVSKDGSFSPTSGQADEWEEISKRYAKATMISRLSSPLFLGLALVCGLLTVAGPFWGVSWILMGPAAFVTAIFVAVVMGGSRSAVGQSVRRWFGTLSWFDMAVGVFGAIVVALVVFLTPIWLGLIVGAILGAIAGAAYHFVVVSSSQRSATQPVMDAEKFIRDLRIQGADETGVRSFAARYAGKSWQSLYESLFGYDSLCEMRGQLGADPTFSTGSTREGLRDRVAARFLSKAEANEQSRDQKRLAKIEEHGLRSEGVSAADAREQAWEMAQAIIKSAQANSDLNLDAAAAAQLKRENQKAMLAEARSGKYKRARDPLAPLKFALGGQTRLIAGCLLLAVFAIWAKNTGMFDKLVAGEVTVADLEDPNAQANAIGQGTSSWSIGIAGVLLCMSAFISGWKMSPFAIVATIVILFGASLGVPSLGPMPAWILAGLIGVAIYVPGIIWGEDKEF